ncbi:MAG: ATP-grasp domain-containing protein [Alteromonas sp.]
MTNHRAVSLIIGQENDPHVTHMSRCLLNRHRKVIVFDASQYPMCHSISWDPLRSEGWLTVADDELRFADICSVYWRYFPALNTTDLIAAQDSMSTIKTLLSEPHINWVNGLNAIEGHKVKPRQLNLAHRLGAKIPSTYVGNCVQAAQRFLAQHRQVIYKPVHGGAHTRWLDADKRALEHLASVLTQAPVTLQSYICGTDIRTYVIGNQTFSVEFTSDRVDYRTDPDCRAEAVAIPSTVQKLARRIMRGLGMQWTAIDWRCDADGRFHFLEANPSPMFLAVEQDTGLPISEALTELLMQPYSQSYSPL